MTAKGPVVAVLPSHKLHINPLGEKLDDPNVTTC